MEFKLKVHSVQFATTPATVKFGDKDVRAQVECLEVQFISDDPMQGGFMRRFTGDDLTAARDTFKKDAEVSVTLKV